MPLWRNHKAWIESDGEKYEEYDVKVEGNVVTCYIASQINKTFQILWMNTEAPMATSSLVYMEVDGAKLDNFVSRHYLGSSSGISRGHWLDATSFRPFKFSHAALIDDDAIFSPSKDLGTISVIVYRVVVVDEKVSYRPEVVPDYFQKPLSERSKKMSGHRIGLDKSQSVMSPRTSVSTTAYQGETSPYVTFRFIYRPKDILRALHIIPAIQAEGSKRPRSPSPVAGPSKSQNGHAQKSKKRCSEVKTEEGNIIDLSDIDDDDEEQQLLAQQAEIARKLEEHRKRKSASGAKGKMKVKTEGDRSTSAGPVDFIYDADGAIDLT